MYTHTQHCPYKSVRAYKRDANPVTYLIPCHHCYYVSGSEAMGSQLCEDEFIRSWCGVHRWITGTSDSLHGNVITAKTVWEHTACIHSLPTWPSSPWSGAGVGSPGSGSPLWTGESWDGVSGGLMTTDLSERLLSLLLLALCRSRLRSLGNTWIREV